ncbi:MAG: polyprenyl synthetase family protein [Clostridia bacterium]
MITHFDKKYAKFSNVINVNLEKYISIQKDAEMPWASLYNSVKYSLMAGGKRLRPVIGLAVAEMLDCDFEKILPYLCAIEMIHTYSLIHDDLPVMDNDDYRRGIPTNHKVFGEAKAVLAGDALLNSAFETMLSDVSTSDLNEYKGKVDAMQFIAKASGINGMIAGQVLDIDSEGKKISESTLKQMHKLKTGALIKASVLAPAYICSATGEQFMKLEMFSENIGLAFQIKDDILDVVGNFENMGKKMGGDEIKNKSTFISMYGLEQSKVKLREATRNAISSLDIFGEKAAFLIELTEFIEKRNK